MGTSTQSSTNLAAISSYTPRTFFLITEIFRRAALLLEIQEPTSEDARHLAMIVSGMRCGVDDIDKLAINAVNIYRTDRARHAARIRGQYPK